MNDIYQSQKPQNSDLNEDDFTVFLEDFESKSALSNLLSPSDVGSAEVDRDVRSELDAPHSLPKRYSADVCSSNAVRQTITSRVSVERLSDKEVGIDTGIRSFILNFSDSYYRNSGSILSTTTTKVDELIYVVIGGGSCHGMAADESRFIFNDEQLADHFKSDLTSAITDKKFVKSDFLLPTDENESPNEFVSAELRKESKHWFGFVCYGVTVVGLAFLGSVAIGYGWGIAKKLL
jgi:hypothetical protein